MPKHPYKDLGKPAFWRTAIADRHIGDVEGLSEPIRLQKTDRIATAGSCFAQHIGNRLAEKGAKFLDFEPAPANWQPNDARRHGFGVYSCRYGNIYTVRQLLQLVQEVLGGTPRHEVWMRDERYFDALRPSVDPEGHASADDVMDLRKSHVAAVKKLLTEMDVLVFTLGLTEGWVNKHTGVVYPTAPGTLAGEYDEEHHGFVNFRYGEIKSDLEKCWELILSVNPRARMILTVSPVPLTATASGHHVLAATTYSKSVLRAVAGDFAADNTNVSYFSSYEIIATSPSAGWFYNPDKRTVNTRGVDLVMENFFASLDGFEADESIDSLDSNDLEVVCEEGDLEKYA